VSQGATKQVTSAELGVHDKAPSPAVKDDGALVTVTVAERTQVNVDGVLHGGGDTVEVDPDTAERWVAAGWATRTPRPAAT
jgi:hypothetical protein